MLKKVAFDASLWRTEQEIQYQARLLALCIAEGAHEDLDFFDPEDKNFVPKLVRRIATGRGNVVVLGLDKAVMNFRDGWYVSRGKTEKLWLDDDYDQLPPDAKPCLVTAGVLSRKPTGRVDDEFYKDFTEALKLVTRIFEETGLLKKPKPSKGEEANEESRESKAGSKTKAKPKSEDTDKGTDEDAGTEGNGEETTEETEGAGEEADPKTEDDAATEDNADETESRSYRSISSGYPDPYIVELKADLRKWYNQATPGGINQHLNNLHNRRERAQLEVEKAEMVIKALLGCLQASSKDLAKLLEEAEWQEDAKNSLRGRVLLSLSKFCDVVQVNNEHIENMAEHTKYLLELRNLREKTAEEENEKVQPNSQEKGKPVDNGKKTKEKTSPEPKAKDRSASNSDAETAKPDTDKASKPDPGTTEEHTVAQGSSSETKNGDTAQPETGAAASEDTNTEAAATETASTNQPSPANPANQNSQDRHDDQSNQTNQGTSAEAAAATHPDDLENLQFRRPKKDEPKRYSMAELLDYMHKQKITDAELRQDGFDFLFENHPPMTLAKFIQELEARGYKV